MSSSYLDLQLLAPSLRFRNLMTVEEEMDDDGWLLDDKDDAGNGMVTLEMVKDDEDDED